MTVHLQDLELLDAVRSFALEYDHPALEKFEASIRDWGDDWIDVSRDQLAVAELLDDALVRSVPQTRALLQTFLDHRKRLRWEQSYSKADGVVSEAMLACYGFAEILGKQGPFVSESIRAGIGIYGPDIEYPIHRHHPEEIYIVLAGAADFMIGEAQGIRKTAGDVVFMKSNTPHGFRTGDQALVVYYLWQGGDLREISSFA
ncbi:MAG: dimethylsulfonioproprionate lyase family protein [Gammaproteobacteria bacterium]|nr:dimethylsulfonioproprionate lyase family protein [Gammaproteobacteria bacterium]